MRLRFVWAMLVCLISIPHVLADTTSLPGVQRLGDLSTGSGWTGLTTAGDTASLALPGEASFSYPVKPAESEAVPRGDWHEWHSLQFDVSLSDDRPVTIEVVL